MCCQYCDYFIALFIYRLLFSLSSICFFFTIYTVGRATLAKCSSGKGKRQPIYHITTQLVHQTDRCGPAFTITRESTRDADLRTDGPEHGLMDKQNINRLTWSKSDIENISSAN